MIYRYNNIDQHNRSIRTAFSKQAYLSIVILFTTLALSLSGCASSQPETVEESAVLAKAEPAAVINQESEPLNTQPDSLAVQITEAAAPAQESDNQVVVQKQAAPTLEAEPAPQMDAQPPSPASEEAAPDPAVVENLPPVEPHVGFLAPDITLTAIDGNAVALSELRGKNVLINYWVTWCVPCMDELPLLSRVSLDYQDQNLVVLTVNGIEQDQLDKVQQIISELGLDQTVLLDKHESFWTTYLVQFLPTSFFIDTQGVIRHIMLGSATEDTLRSTIDQLLAGQL